MRERATDALALADHLVDRLAVISNEILGSNKVAWGATVLVGLLLGIVIGQETIR